MTRRMFGLVLVLATMIGVNSAQLSAAESNVLGPLRTQWTSLSRMMIRIAEVVPEAKYDFKPVPEVRSFREMLTHVITENYFFMSQVTGEKAPDMAPINALKTRAEIVKAMTESYDMGAKVLAGLDEEKAMQTVQVRGQPTPKWSIVMANIIDNMDHYGNLVVYMRLNGIVPPATADRQKK